MTDRRIERSVSSQIAALEARVRGLEALIGGGSQQAIEEGIVSTAEFTTSATFTDLATVGPEVTVTIGPVGNIFVLWSAIIETHLGTAGYGNGGAVAFEVVQGATVVRAPTNADPSLELDHPVNGAFFVAGGISRIIRGLDAGTYTVRLKYRSTDSPNRVDFSNRVLQAFPF